MAYPPNAPDPHRQFRVGIPLALVPSSDHNCDLEIWRKTTDSTGHTLLDVLRADSRGGVPSQYFDTDGIGLSTYSYSYKFRSVKSGALASDFTTELVTQPAFIEGRMPSALPLTGRSIGVDLRLSTGKTLGFGTAGAPKTLTKTIRIDFSAFADVLSTAARLLMSAGYLQATATNTLTTGRASVPLPSGVTVTGCSFRWNKGSSGDALIGSLWRFRPSSGATNLSGNLVPSATGWTATSSTAFTISTVSTDESYYAQIVTRRSSGVGKGWLGFVLVSYRFGDVLTAL